MLFNSYEFVFAFLPITLGIYLWLRSRSAGEGPIVWLVLASLFFYGWWNPKYLLLIVASVVCNYAVARAMAGGGRTDGGRRSMFLVVGIGFNLALLGYYKYANFFLGNVDYVLGADFRLEDVILPLGISFFTFQQIAYLVDVQRGTDPEHNFWHYALFVTFFPQLIAGPIVHHGEMLPQFLTRRARPELLENITVGVTIFFIGLAKKAVLADGIAVYATPVFEQSAHGEPLTLLTAWGGALAYTMQLYFDFSGYSDMAIGAARLFGIRLPLNFHSPYKATSIIEFWRRWHMTLSRFLRDYLYIPLGGNRGSSAYRYRNLMITMLLGGLWHGAGWTFVAWGGLHGGYLVINHGWRRVCAAWGLGRGLPEALRRGCAWTLTFVAVVVGWVFFRAGDWTTAMGMLQGMVGLNGVALPQGVGIRLGAWQEILSGWGVTFYLGGGENFMMTWLWIAALGATALLLPNTQQWMADFRPGFTVHESRESDEIRGWLRAPEQLAWRPGRRFAMLSALVACAGILSLAHVSEFLYFQF